MIVRSQQGDTLDALVWRHYGRTGQLVERVLEANPGLSRLGVVLPMGTPVELPDVAPPPPTNQLINIWD